MQRIYLLSFLLLLMFAACKKSGGDGGGPMSISEYPLKVNNQWTYMVTDSVHNEVDTFVLKIVSKRSDGDTAFWNCNVYSHNSVVDTPCYVQTSTKIWLANSSYNILSPSFLIDFPVSNNNVWIASPFNGDTAVATLLTSTVTIGNRSYSNVYVIARSFQEVDFSFKQNIYIYKGLGLIGESYAVMPFGPQVRKNVELVAYSLN